MKKTKSILYIMLLGAFLITGSSSCKTGEGCEATEHYQAKSDKDGQLSSQKGRSNLFSKKQRKKMKKRK